MSDIEARLEIVNEGFREGTKRYEAARYIVRQNREITTDERKALVDEIPIGYKTLEGLFTELRKMGLYPPQPSIPIAQPAPTPQIVTSDMVPEPQHPQPQLQPEYASLHDLNALRKDIQYLAAVINGNGNPLPVEPEYEVIDEPETEEPQEIEISPPTELNIQDPSLTRHSIWLKPKTQMYFDMARQGIFANYVGTRDLGPFTQFKGNLSDFFNVIVDDYFLRNYNADIGLLMRRYA
ncbi:hypothetical protein LCGC14_1772550 [marine sediment metagenome]|uniref:Uncharacterized protein n=1 Tax=marine sediment metagenome TaxID=412755 RepID=A0A0F9JXH1_9ZZZZ